MYVVACLQQYDGEGERDATTTNQHGCRPSNGPHCWIKEELGRGTLTAVGRRAVQLSPVSRRLRASRIYLPVKLHVLKRVSKRQESIKETHLNRQSHTLPLADYPLFAARGWLLWIVQKQPPPLRWLRRRWPLYPSGGGPFRVSGLVETYCLP